MKKLLVLLLSALILTGCTDKSPAIEDDDGIDWGEYEQNGDPLQPHEKEVELPHSFSMAYHRGSTLDPITCSDGIQRNISQLLYEPLFQLGSDLEPIPLLADSMEWDQSGLTCTIHIREGITFSDGSSLTAADAAATLRRAAESPRYSYRLRDVTSVSSTRSGKIILNLSAPNRGLASLLDIPIVKRGTEGYTAPIGTGPYLPVTGADGDYLTANGDWWQQKPLPVATIPLVNTKDRDTAMYLFSSHRIEILTADPTSDLISVTGASDAVEEPTCILQFLGFNTASGLFADTAYRTAFARGLHREMLAGAFLSGHAEPAQFPIHPRSPLYPAGLEVQYSKDAAAMPLDGENDGSENNAAPAEPRQVRFLVNKEDEFRCASARFITDDLKRSGWAIDLQILPWEDYLAALQAGKFDVYYGQIRLTADWDLRDLLFTGGSMNYGGWSDPVTDSLLTGFVSSEDRRSSATALCRHIQTYAPIAPICFLNYTVLTHPDVVEGIDPSPENTFFQMSQWSVHLAE